MIQSVDLNCDMGEAFGVYSLGQDEQLLKHITSANIACGYHAGDPNVMHRTIQLAKQAGVSVGAHPGFQDLLGFGRRDMNIEPDELKNLLIYQIGALQAFAKVAGVRVCHVKPHGALYNMSATQPIIARAIAEAIHQVDSDLVLFGLAGSPSIQAGRNIGLRVAEEVFADRTYQSDGTLTPRSHSNALIHDVEIAVEQVVTMIKDGVVRSTDGSLVSIQADTVCVHGDSSNAVEFVKRLRNEVLRLGIKIQPKNTIAL
jgi:UPF0271 protein